MKLLSALEIVICVIFLSHFSNGDQGTAAKRISNDIPQDFQSKVDQLSIVNEEEIRNNEQINPHEGKGKFSCLSCFPPNCDHPSICHKAVRCYTAHVRDTDGNEHKSKGCTRNHQQTMFHCSTLSHDGQDFHSRNNKSAQFAFDCCKGSMCNENITFPELPAVPKIPSETDLEMPESEEKMSSKTILAIVIPSMFLLVLFTLVVTIYCIRQNHLKTMDKMARNLDFGNDCELAGLRAHAVGDSTLREYQNGSQETACEVTSGSGSGMTMLTQRRFAKDITLHCEIGGGRYGQVWKGAYNGDEVAVKIFNTRDEDSFLREMRIYSTECFGHDNILRYIDADCTSRNACTQHWLVTQYHRRGSLYDFLNVPGSSLTAQETFNLLFSALKGLVHLHNDINGTQKKPKIAHRDLKSKNILVKEEEMHNGMVKFTCVLADFGLAVTKKELPDLVLTEVENTRVGTKRYMSPEVLSLKILEKKSREIEDFLKSDMYSFALVMWEVLRKTRLVDTDPTSAEEFALPYHMHVASDPSFEDMKKVVYIDEQRPGLPYEPKKFKRQPNPFIGDGDGGACKLMEDCWKMNPSARLSSLRLQKNLEDLANKCGLRTQRPETFITQTRAIKVPMINSGGGLST